MKIALYSTSAERMTKQDLSYPLGLIYLAAVLERDGHKVMVNNYFNIPWRIAEARIAREIAIFEPDIVGVSMLTMNRISSFKTIQLIKKLFPNIKIIAGGVHVATLYESILQTYPVDLIVIGEGERTICELVRAIENKKSLSEVNGIAFQSGDKCIVTSHRELIKNLDEIPYPKHEYFREYIERSGKAHMMSTRGCPVGCQFCSTTQYWGKVFRSRSPINVVDEMSMLVQMFGVKHIMFMDDAFTLNPKRVIAICQEIIERGLKIEWDCSTRVTSVSEEMISWMVKAGCTHTALGVESGSPKILGAIGKKITPNKIKEAFGILERVGMSAGIYLMVGNPGETEKTITETKQLLREITTEEITSVAILQIYPQTELYKLAKEKGLIDDNYWLIENAVPYYTAEQSIATLEKFAYSIILSSHKKRGIWGVLRFCMKMLREQPQKCIKIGLRYPLVILRMLFK